jgi:predicted DNA-binding protein
VPRPSEITDFVQIAVQNEETMSDNNRTPYANRLTVHITGAMDNRLEQIASQRDEPKAEVVRAALRAYLDEQEDLIGSRKHFTKAFQRRMDYQEWMLVVLLELVSHSLGTLLSEIGRQPFDSALLLEYALKQARAEQDQLHTRLLEALAGKHEPPA